MNIESPTSVQIETTETQIKPATTRQRAALTPEQREQKNLRAREQRAAKTSAKQIEQAGPAPVATVFAPLAPGTGTLGQQQARRDQPFQQALSLSLQTRAKARNLRLRESQLRQAEIRKSHERTHSGDASA
jgi:hypothetical protein